MSNLEKKFFWASRVLALLAVLSGAIAGYGFLPVVYTQIFGACAGLCGIGSRWCEQQLPPTKAVEKNDK